MGTGIAKAVRLQVAVKQLYVQSALDYGFECTQI